MLPTWEYISLYARMKKMRRIIPGIIITALLLVQGCAQQGAPTGGPQDEDPPVVKKATPENYSTNFSEGKIMITFDEYLDMANFTQELVVSPPVKEKPQVKLRNKTLIIEFEEELKEDATYTFNFGEGIKDLNEKNVLLNYEYVFSTGDYLDSLSVKGTLKNAFDLTVPKIPIYVMLYTELEDSLPLIEIPYYVGRTDAKGNFAVNNLKKGIYKVFVLKDGNNNFLFDQPNEEIAFLDTSLFVDGDYFRNKLLQSGVYDSADLYYDTIAITVDTAGMSQDSITMVLDSLERAKPDFNTVFLDLFMFTEDPVEQYVTDYSRNDRYALKIIFNLPLTDSFAFNPVFPASLKSSDLVPEFGQNRDSLTIWTADTLVAFNDTIGVELTYTVLDSLFNPVIKRDTLRFTYRERSSGRSKEKKKEEPQPLAVSTIKNRGKQHIQRDLTFTLNQPVGTIDSSLFELYIIPDTIEVPVPVKPVADIGHLRRVRISNPWKEEGRYRMVLYPGAITNIYGLTNDTIDVKFNIRPLAEYGRINLTLENVEDTLLIEVYRKGSIARKKEVFESGSYVFDFLDPDTYRIKCVHDRNRNGKWDTGKYMEGRQPEKVEFLPKDVKVRANWDHDLTYVIGSNDVPPTSATETDESRQPLF